MFRQNLSQLLAASATVLMLSGAALAQSGPSEGRRMSRINSRPAHDVLLGKQIPAQIRPAHLPSGMIGLQGKVLRFAESKIGQTVGDGQCWALVDQALAAAGAAHPSIYVFGRALGPNEQILPGDLIQFSAGQFDWMRVDERHSAVIRSHNGRTVVLVEQNANHVMSVTVSSPVDLTKTIRGTYTIYRPIPR